MSLQKNIGKNTIGDNNKMSVDLHTYNMSTHDLSTIFRNTQSAGTLVPNLVLLAQKGDTIDIDIESHVLTHPTVGPLFGSFKHENHIFSIPIRLYNSWLHNNRTKIGLKSYRIEMTNKKTGQKEIRHTLAESKKLAKCLIWTKNDIISQCKINKIEEN